jgi:glycosyltransferase involved in cell wall biosynthesis
LIFKFLKYLQPTHYFQLLTDKDGSIFPIIEHLPDNLRLILKEDKQFKNHLAMTYDQSWRAIHQGYINTTATYHHFEDVTVDDNYVFIRKYFHKVWVWYVLLIRLISLKNPFKEVAGFWKSRKVNRIQIKPLNLADTQPKELSLVINALVSVVIPTLNRYDYLEAILKDFEQQTYTNFEVIVVDQSDNFQPDFYKPFQLNIKVIRQEEKALWLARNTAIKEARGTIIALSEDDVRIEPDWLELHLRCLQQCKAKVSAGLFYKKETELTKITPYFRIAQQFATGNAVLYKEVFKKVGLFDRQFEKQRMGDGEFGMRLYLAGVKCIENPFAYCIDLKAQTGGLRDMGSWDAFRPTRWFSPRPIPSVLYYYRRYFGNKAARLALLKTVPFSLIPYQYKRNKPMLIAGLMLSLLMLPLVCFQVWKSWQLASVKLKEGPRIERL